MAAAEVDPSPNPAPTSDLPNGNTTKSRETDRRRRRRKAKKNKAAARDAGADAKVTEEGASAADAKEKADPNSNPLVSELPRRISIWIRPGAKPRVSDHVGFIADRGRVRAGEGRAGRLPTRRLQGHLRKVQLQGRCRRRRRGTSVCPYLIPSPGSLNRFPGAALMMRLANRF